MSDEKPNLKLKNKPDFKFSNPGRKNNRESSQKALRQTKVDANDSFISEDSAKQYCSILSSREDELPLYLEPFEEFLNNVLDISEETYNEIGKLHMEREWKYQELDREEEEQTKKKNEDEMKVKNKLDYEVAKILNIKRKYVKRSCPVRIPFKSTIARDEHEFYIKCFIKYQMRGPANSLEEKEYEQYMSMQNKVFDEQSCMMNFSFKVAQLVIDQYNMVPHEIESYITQYYSHRCQRVSSYSEHYKNEIQIPLKPVEFNNSGEPFEFKYVGHLLSMGSVGWIKLPNEQSIVNLKNVKIGKNKPQSDSAYNRKEYLYKCPVSEDPNAQMLAQKYGANIVMSASAFKTIVDNQEQPFDKEWNIPIRIKPSSTKDVNGKDVESRIIYIDKPLPRKTWLPLHKKFTYFKAAAQEVLTMGFRPPYNLSKFRKSRYSSSECETDISSIEDASADISHREMWVPSQPQPQSPSASSGIIESDLFLSEDDDVSDNEKKAKINAGISTPCSSVPTESPPKDRDPQINLTGKSEYVNSVSSSNLERPPKLPGAIQGGRGKRKRESESDDTFNKSKEEQNSTPSVNEEQKRDSSLDHKPLQTFTKASFAPQNSRSGYPYHKGKKRKKQHEATNSRESTLPGHTGFLENILDEQTSFLNTKSAPVLPKNIPNIMSAMERKNHYKKKKNKKFQNKLPWFNTMKTNWKDHKLKYCPEKSKINVHYQLFSFEKIGQGPAKQDKVEPVKILVRHNVHGLANTTKYNKSLQAYVIFPKIENQSYFGCEVNSLSEISQQWAILLLRPNIKLLQTRICVESGSVLMTEDKTMETVLKDGKQKHINFNQQSVFSTLNVMFNTLQKMSSGEYLLQHNQKTGAFMNLMKAVDSERATFVNNSFNMHEFYSQAEIVSMKYKSPPWLAVDTHVLTPFHLMHKKIPATFPMENDVKLSSSERKRRRAKALKKKALEGFL